MNKITYREGPQPLEYWREWKKQVRRHLRNDTSWAKGKMARETLEGIAAEPVNYPHFEDELEIFPRNIDIRFLAEIINHPEKRKGVYEKRLRMMADNFKVEGRGEHTFVILPQTFERILAQIEMRRSKIKAEVIRLAIEYFFKGRRAHETDIDVSIPSLTSYLRDAEKELDILGDSRGELNIVTRTLEVSYTVLRYAREEQLDFRHYFKDRIF